MDLRKARRAIRDTAKKHGLTEKEAVEEIEATIAETLETIRTENDIAALAKWKQIPCRADVPTAYELVAYLGERLSEACSGKGKVH